MSPATQRKVPDSLWTGLNFCFNILLIHAGSWLKTEHQQKSILLCITSPGLFGLLNSWTTFGCHSLSEYVYFLDVHHLYGSNLPSSTTSSMIINHVTKQNYDFVTMSLVNFNDLSLSGHYTSKQLWGVRTANLQHQCASETSTETMWCSKHRSESQIGVSNILWPCPALGWCYSLSVCQCCYSACLCCHHVAKDWVWSFDELMMLPQWWSMEKH